MPAGLVLQLVYNEQYNHTVIHIIFLFVCLQTPPTVHILSCSRGNITECSMMTTARRQHSYRGGLQYRLHCILHTVSYLLLHFNYLSQTTKVSVDVLGGWLIQTPLYST